jgi:hypothetical protein
MEASLAREEKATILNEDGDKDKQAVCMGACVCRASGIGRTRSEGLENYKGMKLVSNERNALYTASQSSSSSIFTHDDGRIHPRARIIAITMGQATVWRANVCLLKV